MAACTLDRLIEGAARRLQGPGGVEGSRELLGDVWEVLDRYISACLEHKRGVVLPSFCRVGWQVVQLKGGATYRPYFQLLETFSRSFNVKSGAAGCGLQGEPCSMEELNFSKAAIRFSTKLTKDHVFTGLRCLVQQIGEVVSQGRIMTLAFSFGKLMAQEREMRLAFVPELYLEHGLEVPTGDADKRVLRPPPEPISGDSLASLSLCGTASGTTASSAATGAGRGKHRPSCDGTAEAPEKPQKHALDDALHRHISELETRASEAMRDQAVTESQVFMAQAHGEREQVERQAQKRQNAVFLQKQIEARESRKRAESTESQQQPPAARSSSASVLPAEMPRPEGADLAALQKRNMLTSSMKEVCAEQLAALAQGAGQMPTGQSATGSLSRAPPRPNGFRQALDEQVQAKRERNDALREFERRLDADLSAVRSHEAAARKEVEQANKARERDALENAWREESKMRDIKRNIEAMEFGRRLPPSTGSKAASSSAAQPPGGFGLFATSLTPRSARGVGPCAEGSTNSSSGPPSARRMALNAAASLALASPRAVEAM